MAAQVAPSARSAFAKAEIDWVGDNFIVVLTAPTYTYSSAHIYQSSISGIVGFAPLSSKQVLDNGVCDAADCSVPGVDSGESVGSVLIVQDNGSPATNRIVYATNVHTDGTNILRVGDGNEIVVSWSNGPGRIFQI